MGGGMETRPDPMILEIPGIEDPEPIGRRGFGTVYRGRQRAVGREVGVKGLAGSAVAASSRRRFGRGAMAMGARSGQPNVVPVYAPGSVGGRPNRVMPLLRAGSLEDQLRGRP